MSKTISSYIVDLESRPNKGITQNQDEFYEGAQIVSDNLSGNNKINLVDPDLSEFNISETGVILDKSWINTYNFHCQVIDVNEDEVILDCLIDESENIFEKRAFDKKLFSNIKDLKFGYLILVRCFDNYNLGESKVKILDGTRYVNKKLFDSSSTVEKLKNLSIFNLD